MSNVKIEYLIPIVGMTLMQIDPNCALRPKQEVYLLVYHIVWILFIMSLIGFLIVI